MLAGPDVNSTAVATLGSGGSFAMLDLTGGWAWGYAVDGHIVGYVEESALQPVG